MAPSVILEPSTVTTFEAKGAPPVDKLKTVLVNEDGLKYPEYYPTNDPNDVFPDPEPFDYHDRALDADPAMPVFYNDYVQIEEVCESLITSSLSKLVVLLLCLSSPYSPEVYR